MSIIFDSGAGCIRRATARRHINASRYVLKWALRNMRLATYLWTGSEESVSVCHWTQSWRVGLSILYYRLESTGLGASVGVFQLFYEGFLNSEPEDGVLSI